MSRLLLDTNILIDLVSSDRPQHASAAALVRTALASGSELAALASSLKDVYYIFASRYGAEGAARESIRNIRAMMTIVDLTLGMVDRAFDDGEPDFEDGLIREAAEAIGADILVTRDAKGFRGMSIRVLDAEGALRALEAARQ